MSAYQSSFDFEWDEEEKEVGLRFGSFPASHYFTITPAEALDLRAFLSEREDVLHEALEEALYDEQGDPDEVSE